MTYQNEITPELIELTKQHEGFKDMPYKDTRGFWTIGYGTKLPISEKEAEMLLMNRLSEAIIELVDRKPFILKYPPKIKQVLYEMAYQLGVSKLMEFKRMWKAVENRDWESMIKEMYDSRWYRQTPNRVEDLVKLVKEVIEEEKWV